MLYIHERRILNEIINLVEQDKTIEKAVPHVGEGRMLCALMFRHHRT
ncbi:MAG: hypothetical protein ACE5R6_08235 [Candidatus Heimdallarchaeota archaeon]